MDHPAEAILALTPDQQKLYEGTDVESVVQRAARAVVRDWGQIMPHDDLLQEGRIAVALATRTFDPAEGSFEAWAFLSACYGMLESSRSEVRHSTMKRFGNLISAVRVAAFGHFARDERTFDAWHDSQAFMREQRNGFSDSTLLKMARAVASCPVTTGGEDELVERETAARAARALKVLVDNLRSDQQELLDLCFVKGLSVKQVAANLGQKYQDVLKRYHELERLIGARLAGQGFRGMPSLPEESGGTILGRHENRGEI